MNNVIGMLRNSRNPQALLQSMARQNPQIKQILDLVGQSGSPKQAFYNLANQKGVNPNSVLTQLRDQFR